MSTDKRLLDIFEKSKVADEIRFLVDNAIIIIGSGAFDKNQKNITDFVSTGRDIYEWQVQGKEDVLLMSEKYAKALLSLSDMKIVEDRMQYPAKSFDRARFGEVALGLIKERTPTVAMINKQKVINLIDPLARHENDMQEVVDRIQIFMQERNLLLSDMNDVMDNLEIQYPIISSAHDLSND